MQLQNIVLIRHGDYIQNGGNLTEKGKEQVKNLGLILKKIFAGEEGIMFSSPTLRARQTSDILAECFGFNFECLDILNVCKGKNMSEEEAGKIMNLIMNNAGRVEVIILSAHLDHVSDFPVFLAKRFGFQLPSNDRISTGSARVINIQTKTEFSIIL